MVSKLAVLLIALAAMLTVLERVFGRDRFGSGCVRATIVILVVVYVLVVLTLILS